MCFSSQHPNPTFNRQAIISGTSLGAYWNVWASTASWPPQPPCLLSYFMPVLGVLRAPECRQNPLPWSSTHYIPHHHTPTLSFYALLIFCVWKLYQILKSAHSLIYPFPQVTVSPHDFLISNNLPMDSLCPSQKAKGSLLCLDLASPQLRSEIPFVYPQIFFHILYRHPQKTSVIITTELPGQDSSTLLSPRTLFSQMVSLPLLRLFSRIAKKSDPDEINKLLTCPSSV